MTGGGTKTSLQGAETVHSGRPALVTGGYLLLILALTTPVKREGTFLTRTFLRPHTSWSHTVQSRTVLVSSDVGL
jgi:hypothetical protein